MFKIRASASGQIMSMAKGGLTDKQKEKIVELEAKEKLTDKQKDTLEELKAKEGQNSLSSTAKTYCKEWVIEQMTGRRKELKNKYVEKGILVEDDSINYAKHKLGWGDWTFKNEKYFEDDHFTGTPDIILDDEIVDIKSSWDVYTFPWFDKYLPTKAYYWQLQVYMALTGKEKASVVYVLTDAPTGMIERELYYMANQGNLDTIDPEMIDEVQKRMDFSDLRENMDLLRVFPVERNDSDIEKLRKKVEECRRYISAINTFSEIKS